MAFADYCSPEKDAIEEPIQTRAARIRKVKSREGAMTSEPVLRILDVNRNRCFEAMRVVEEYTRFVLNNKELSGRIKALRHNLFQSFSEAGLKDLSEFRQAGSDVGAPGQTSVPADPRQNPRDVLGANLSRARESFRALEEYSRPGYLLLAESLERGRYTLYQLEKDILDFALRRDLRARLKEEPLCLLLSPGPGRPPVLEMAKRARDGGCGFFQLRLKNVCDQEHYETACRIGEFCAQSDALFVVNDRSDIARSIPGTGVHLGQEDLPVTVARGILGARRILGLSLHTEEERAATLTSDVDYVGVGTIFSSPTKPELGAAGLGLLAELSSKIELACFAIGGISTSNVDAAMKVGGTGVAVSSAILDAPDMTATTAEIVKKARAARDERLAK